MKYKDFLHFLSWILMLAFAPCYFWHHYIGLVCLFLSATARGDAIMREIRELKEKIDK